MFGIPKRTTKNKNKNYKLLYNNEDINITLKKIVTVEEKIESLIKTNKFLFRHGFFIRRQKAFNSYFFNYKVDLIFADYNGKILKAISSFETNKISDYYDKAHYCLVLPENTIDYFNIFEGSHIKIQK